MEPLDDQERTRSAEHEKTSRTRDARSVGRLIRNQSPGSAQARRTAFAAFVRGALHEARVIHGWTGSEVARRTGVSRQTINRWVRGEWTADPEAERVVAFCKGLDRQPGEAFGVLGWDRAVDPRPAPAPPPMDPDVAALLRRLVDPDISEAEKFHIRETVRYLAYRPALPLAARTAPRRAG